LMDVKTKPKQTQLKPIQTQFKPNKAKFKPNQSQFTERTKLMHSVYIQRNKNKNADRSYEKTNNRTYFGG
jgi:hypothetical protein